MTDPLATFIASHPDWMARLELDLRIFIMRDGDLASLKYNQHESPMEDPIVRQCRGTVVHVPSGRILAHPYDKFWNHGEPLADDIDWTTARVLEKLDGSLMILYWHEEGWHVASSGNPTAGGVVDASGTTFRDLFWRVWNARGMRLPTDRTVCFMFELCTRANRIVVHHPKDRLVLHGARDMRTDAELSLDSLSPIAAEHGWEVVGSFPIGTSAEALASAEALDPRDSEGFVVVDASFHRLKVKSPRYVLIHHIRGEGMSRGRAIDLWISGETPEVLAHYPEYEPDITPVHRRLDALADRAHADFLERRHLGSRKEFALAASELPWSALLFKLYADPGPTPARARELMRSQGKAYVTRLLGTEGI